MFVLNGSPKGNQSNTLRVTESFLDGLNSKRIYNVYVANINEKNIEHCRGCFSCWTQTPGKCIIKDDMKELITKYINADLIIWSFPLYYFGMPSKVKAFLDRMLPIHLPYISINDDETSCHPLRYDLSHQRYILISTCGLYGTKNNYEALLKQFEFIFKDRLTKIICPEGELFSIPQIDGRTSRFLTHVKQAGKEFSTNGVFSEHTKRELNKLLLPPKIFIELVNTSWSITDSSINKNS
ncbi:NAD(P)H-dependent oxidoreductase [Clostridium felsineum]|uniref:NAD(P)H-dependent oxidoreductase n=1 Tax=Clostridium felsineum TaxID=36839 RepID=UPI001FA93446|nr:NAD(P)H-dependent oxidoreductase [Clostridium felsineum]